MPGPANYRNPKGLGCSVLGAARALWVSRPVCYYPQYVMVGGAA